MDNIIIAQQRLTAKQYVEFLTRTDLGSQYAKERFVSRIEKLVNNASTSVVATTADGTIVGVCFGLTDFCYWLLITDIGIDRQYTHMGIGKRMIDMSLECAGGQDDIIIFVSSHQDATGFYEKIGMKKTNHMLVYDKAQWTEFVVDKTTLAEIDG